MKRVVVTGLGIVSSIGNNAEEVTESLRHARSGIVAAEIISAWASAPRCMARLKINLDEVVDRRARRFQGDGAGYCWVAMNQAIADAGLAENEISNPRTGLIVGSGGPSTKAIVQAADITARTIRPSGSGLSRCPRRCRPPSAPIFPPGSRPRATIIPSARLLDLGQLHRQCL